MKIIYRLNKNYKMKVKNFNDFDKTFEYVDYTDFYDIDIDQDIENRDINYYNSLVKDIKSKIRKTIKETGESFNRFVEEFNNDPENYKIEGLIHDYDLYEFYLKHINDIDEILNNVKFFKKPPSESEAYGLYDYIIKGTERAIIEVIKEI